MPGSYIFTSESVSGGHPDKMADQISDAVLDALLTQDHRSRVACETLVKTGMVMLAGEITTNAEVDLEALVRKTVCDIGYDNPNVASMATPARYSPGSASNPATSPWASTKATTRNRAPATRA